MELPCQLNYLSVTGTHEEVKETTSGVTLFHFNTGSEDSTQVTKLAQEALLPAESFYWTPTPL